MDVTYNHKGKTLQFKPQFTAEEQVRWRRTLEQLYVHKGPDDLGLAMFNLIGGIKERTFSAHVDRTKTYNDIIVCSPIPEMAPAKTFNECVANRARKIHAVIKEHSLTPYLMWSGGLDSTGVLYALLDEGVKFNVIFDQTGRNEYPKVAQQLLNNEIENATAVFNYGNLTFPEHPRENKTALYLTGEIGDQTFGSEGMAKFDYEAKQTPVVDCIGKLISRDLYEATAQSISKVIISPTWSEYLWALSFIYKYQDVQLRIGAMGLSSFGPKQNTFHFFNDDEFQLYTLNNYKENCSFANRVDYKLPLKKYILAQNGDEEYFSHKTKEGSYLIGAYSASYTPT